MLCICTGVGRVDNRTAVFILQHPRERFHPIGTARIAQLGLSRVELAVAWNSTRQRSPFELPPGAGLLYPGPDAQRLDELDDAERPGALVVLDGTWHHARTLYRDHRWLHALPRYVLVPRAPSRYRIRREPSEGCVSTIESIAEALSLLEPGTEGIDALLDSFDGMIEAQIEQARLRRSEHRVRRRRPRAWRAIPRALIEEFERLLVVYGESAQAGPRGHKNREIVYWTALEPYTGRCLARVVCPRSRMPDAEHLEHMGLERHELERGVSLDELRHEWTALCHIDTTVAAWNQSTLDLLRGGLGYEGPALSLKAVYCNVQRHGSGTLESVVKHEGLPATPTPIRGRAGERLGNAVAVAQYLRQRAMQ